MIMRSSTRYSKSAHLPYSRYTHEIYPLFNDYLALLEKLEKTQGSKKLKNSKNIKSATSGKKSKRDKSYSNTYKTPASMGTFSGKKVNHKGNGKDLIKEGPTTNVRAK